MSFINELIEIVDFYRKNFPDIYGEAFSLLKEHSVKKYLLLDSGFIIRTVVGEEGEYLININPLKVFGSVCSCKDYAYNVMFRSKKGGGVYRFFCHHLLATLISILAEYAYSSPSEKLGLFRKKDLLPEIYVEEKQIALLLTELI